MVMRTRRQRSGGSTSMQRFFSWLRGNNAMLQSSTRNVGVTMFSVWRRDRQGRRDATHTHAHTHRHTHSPTKHTHTHTPPHTHTPAQQNDTAQLLQRADG